MTTEEACTYVQENEETAFADVVTTRKNVTTRTRLSLRHYDPDPQYNDYEKSTFVLGIKRLGAAEFAGQPIDVCDPPINRSSVRGIQMALQKKGFLNLEWR